MTDLIKRLKEAKPVRTFSVTVDGYGSADITARSRGHALAQAWRNDVFGHLTFKEFLKIARARNPYGPRRDWYPNLRRQYPDCCIPDAGARIAAEGHTGTVLPALHPTSYVLFQSDKTGEQLCVHPASVALLEAMEGQDG